MGLAQVVWDAAKHPRASHGRFAHGTATRYHEPGERVGRSPSAFQPRESAAARRMRKHNIQTGTEVARGVRPPKNWREESDLHWPSPRSQERQRALTGDIRMPRRDAIRMARHSASGFHHKVPTVGTKKTFAGQTRRVRDWSPDIGVRPTVSGANALVKLAEHGDRRVRLRPKAATARAAASVQAELKGVRGRNNLAAIAHRHGVAVSPLDTEASIRKKILAAAGR